MQYSNKGECMKLVDENSVKHPNLMSVDAGEVFVGGRYHSLVPILHEIHEGQLQTRKADVYCAYLEAITCISSRKLFVPNGGLR